jgi:hypothetical protein
MELCSLSPVLGGLELDREGGNMRATGLGIIVVALAVLLTSCVAQERTAAGRAGQASSDSVQILSISPNIETVLSVGEKVPLRVEVQYILESAQSGTITLVVQQGEQGHEPLANETHVIQKGSGKLVLTKEIDVPNTKAIQVFTPLSARGATSTSVVDTRAYGVGKR